MSVTYGGSPGSTHIGNWRSGLIVVVGLLSLGYEDWRGAVLGAIFLCFVYAAAICHKLVGIKWREFIADHIPGLLLAGIVLAAGWPAHAALKSAGVESIIVLIGTGFIIVLATLIPALLLPSSLLGPDGAKLRDRAKEMMGKIGGTGE